MKIIYSVFNNLKKLFSELRFRIVLDYNDYVLINQFDENTFIIIQEIDKDYFFHVSKSNFKEGYDNRVYIEIEWGKNKLKEMKEDFKIIGWETEEIIIKKYHFEVTLNEFLKKISDDIKKIMKRCKDKKPNNDSSCYEKEMLIKY